MRLCVILRLALVSWVCMNSEAFFFRDLYFDVLSKASNGREFYD
jgi:hypothetical protein